MPIKHDNNACVCMCCCLLPGDFWDRRGDLPVIPLNTIQQAMAAWQDTPLLMLPGNHDQACMHTYAQPHDDVLVSKCAL